MGKSIDPRLIDGKEVPAQFIVGRYQSGLDGKLCDGRDDGAGSFIPGR
jgi:hypothetical protein